jgi:chromosome segregation ATPase
MHQKSHLLVFILLALVAPTATRGDDQQAQSAESRMRQALRDTMIQLRDAQNQVVTLQAAQTQSDKDKADLQTKVDALGAQVKSLSDKTIADLKAQVADETGQIARLNDGLKQWKDAYNQAAQLATAKEAARAQLALQAALLQRTIDDRETKNLELYKLSNEILTRYERFGLGDALAAKEPFVGVTRVTLENLVQDYKNKILDQAVTSGAPLPAMPAGREQQTKANTPAPAEPADPTRGVASK